MYEAFRMQRLLQNLPLYINQKSMISVYVFKMVKIISLWSYIKNQRNSWRLSFVCDSKLLYKESVRTFLEKIKNLVNVWF